jgi:uncharacterized protein YozE (UPF0346 family)
MTPQDRHTQYQNILARENFNTLQFPKATNHYKQVANWVEPINAHPPLIG